ncbi:M42 family metallopeptidase [Membranicola marinus]|uniref:M42 family metallopeptidase n=1 Tax=Membranihabitans marinus TaxID=1227546 RepID=A0A953L6L3_9BACT|nr:M42 family metallopeptidase [Membranihabitans marinus]MBY5957777.1 M42 family metallopeptidase [Membranihabitans marinus]
MTDFELLKKISECPGAPGFEQPIRSLILEHLDGIVDEVRMDSMGSIIARIHGKSEDPVMVTAHMDEIGFIVTHIDDQGFIRFHTLGGFDPKTLTSQRVIVHGKEDVIGIMGTKPIHIMNPEDRKKAPKIEDYFIDTGHPVAKVKELISVGNPITRERALIKMGNCYNGKSLDNRISVFILLKALEQLAGSELDYPIDAVFTVQEEVGLRGAINAAGHVNPRFGINLDVTIAYDVPGAQPHEMVTQLGHGTAIKIMDGSAISDYRMVRYMQGLAAEHNIPWQHEILPAGGTDTAGIQKYGQQGSIAGALSIPLRNMHQVIETVHESDVQATIDLLVVSLQGLGDYDWAFN